MKLLNGAYSIAKELKENFVCAETKWTEIPAFTHTLASRSIVIMTVDVSYKQPKDGWIGTFMANSYYQFYHNANEVKRIQMCRAFLCDPIALCVHIGGQADAPVTLLGDPVDSFRYAHVEYVVIPVG